MRIQAEPHGFTKHLNLRLLVTRVRYATDVAGVCPQGHYGHQHDAVFCRICGDLLTNPLPRRLAMPEKDQKPGRPAGDMPKQAGGSPDVSWTDASDDKLRTELERLGQPTDGNHDQLVKRLEDADKPTGWKWEG